MKFRNFFRGRRKLVQIAVILLVLLLVGVIGKIFSDRFFPKAASNPQWSSTDDLINHGKMSKREKILELTFSYNADANPIINLTKSQIKNGYAPKYQDLPDSYKLQVSDSSAREISSIQFKIPNEIMVDDETNQANNGLKKLSDVNFSLTIPWNENISKITISDTNGKNILENSIKKGLNIGEVQNFNKPDSRSIYGDQLINKGKQSKSIFKNVLAATDQYYDLTFISVGYTDFNLFHNDVTRYSNRLLTVEPFKSRASQIRFNYVDNSSDLGCKPSQACDLAKVIQAVNDAGIPYDSIGVIVANSAARCNFAYWGYPPMYYICAATTGNSQDEYVNIHELGHVLELGDEYIFGTSPGELDNKIHMAVCYAGLPPALEWQNKVALKDYSLGCSYTSNWYRSSPVSIMLRGIDGYFNFFNTVSQEQLKNKLDFYAAPFNDSTKPTINITFPLSNQTINNDIEITNSNSDNKGVTRVQLWIDGKFYQTQYQPPYKFTWATINENDGSHTIQLKAFDANGNMGVSSVKTIILKKKIFPDVASTDPFYKYILALYKKGITIGAPCPSGYSAGKTCYYPESKTSRQETAAFLTRSANLPINYQKLLPDFKDVPGTNQYYFDIMTLYNNSFINACDTSSYPYSFCPTNNITRAQLAVFLTKTAKMSLYTGTEQPFSDVPKSHPQYKEIMTLYKAGIVSGYPTTPLTYRPDGTVLRKEMAKFLVNTFKVPL